VELSTDPKGVHNKLLSMGTGVFLLIFSIAVVVFDASNFLAFGLAFFVLMIGIMLVMVGALNDMDKKPKESSPTRTEIFREIVKVRRRYCSALNLETNQRCSNCGAQL
jgi:hypothetical protein